MGLNLEQFTAPPQEVIRFGSYGLDGRGKSFTAFSAACALHKQRGMTGHIALLDTHENSDGDWYERVLRATGKPLVTYKTRDINKALRWLREAEDTEGIDIIIVDSGTTLLKAPRQAWMTKHGKDKIPLQAYQGIDRPFKALVAWAETCSKHLFLTMREKDDREERDGTEVTVGKKADAGDLAYAVRIKAHCRLAAQKGRESVHVVELRDAKASSTRMIKNPTFKTWIEYFANRSGSNGTTDDNASTDAAE